MVTGGKSGWQMNQMGNKEKVVTRYGGKTHIIGQDGNYIQPAELLVRLWPDGRVQVGNGQQFLPVEQLEIGGQLFRFSVAGYAMGVKYVEEQQPEQPKGIIISLAERRKLRNKV